MDIKKIFDNKLIIVIAFIFILVSVFDIIYATLSQRGLIYDGCIWFPEILSYIEDQHVCKFMTFWGVRSRGLINVINTLPLNTAVMLFHIKSKIILSAIFCFPLFFNTFISLVAQYFLTLRSKRIDIFLSALFLHSALIIPISMYAIVEINLAAALLMLLFHYLSADIEFKKYDIAFIVFLTVVSYLSTEALVYCGFLLFFISLYYIKKADTPQKKFVKFFIGINCFLISIFQIALFHWFNWGYVNSDRASGEYEALLNYFSSYYFKIDIAVFILALFVLFKKSRFKIISVSFLSAVSAAFFIFVVYNAEFMTNIFFIKRYFPYLFLPLFFVINTFYDIFSKHINKEKIKAVFYNLSVVFFITGLLNLAFSITNTYVFGKSVKEFKTITSGYEGKLISPAVDLKDFYAPGTPGYYLFNCDTYIYDKLNFSDEYKFKTFLTPFEEEGTGCPQKFYFDEHFIHLPFDDLLITNSYWDLSEIKNIIDKDETLREKYKAENFETFEDKTPEENGNIKNEEK